MVAKRLGQIKQSKSRVVFFEEKRLTPDAFQFPVSSDGIGIPTWLYDKPNIMHGNGANFGFADGHADFHEWQCDAVISWSKTVSDDDSVGAPTAAQLSSCHALKKQDSDYDWLLNAIWGVTLTQ